MISLEMSGVPRVCVPVKKKSRMHLVLGGRCLFVFVILCDLSSFLLQHLEIASVSEVILQK